MKNDSLADLSIFHLFSFTRLLFLLIKNRSSFSFFFLVVLFIHIVLSTVSIPFGIEIREIVMKNEKVILIAVFTTRSVAKPNN